MNWIYSRILEFAGWINQTGYVHAGFTPDSIYTVPETHGIQVISFYHMTKIDDKLKTISGKYAPLYPASVFKNKNAYPGIDIDLAKKIAITLLGDKSGAGTRLRASHNSSLINYLQTLDSDPIESYYKYRKLLDANFKKEFVVF